METLPDEIILKVMSYLETRVVLQCGQVSNRIRAISRDELLWQKINLANSTPLGYYQKRPISYSTDFLEMILNNGCKYLNLHGTKLNGTLNLKKSNQLRYLDLSGARTTPIILEEILDSCNSLEKLSLSYSELNRNYIFVYKLIVVVSSRGLVLLGAKWCHPCNLACRPYNSPQKCT